jgi:endonuclease/exonuclease/phosphatase family metal-dependent hydrolase
MDIAPKADSLHLPFLSKYSPRSAHLGHPFDGPGADSYTFEEVSALASVAGEPHDFAFTKYISEWRKLRSYKQLEANESFKQLRPQIEHWLRVPLIHRAETAGQPDRRDPDRRHGVDVVSWNINRGRHIEGILEAFRSDAVLKNAGIILLNEVDVGFARSGNRNVFRELASRLNFHGVYTTGYLTLTRGAREDLLADGENLIGSQGNAILSRFPIKRVARLGLPLLKTRFGWREHQIGTDAAVAAEIELPDGKTVVAICVHLEVFTNREERAGLIHHLLGEAEKHFSRDHLWILGGDFNTGVFSLRNKRAAIGDALKFMMSRSKPWKNPFRNEPLFELLEKQGFLYRDLSDLNRPTSVYDSKHSTERQKYREFIPAPIFKVIESALTKAGRLELHLDWLAARPGLAQNCQFKPHNPQHPVWPHVSDHLPVGTHLTWA